MQFSGFLPNVSAIPVPEPVLSILLEEIQDSAELKVTLRAFWLCHRRPGRPPAVPLQEFLNDKVLVQGLLHLAENPRQAIQRGLDLAVSRKTLLAFQPDGQPADEKRYAINTAPNRRALESLSGSGIVNAPPTLQEPAYEPTPAKPNIFTLYENNIGSISPMMAEQLKEAEAAYPLQWIEEAIEIGVNQNIRRWAYISAILKRWDEEGKQDGKSGGHSQKDNREKYIEEFRRRRGHLPGQPRPR